MWALMCVSCSVNLYAVLCSSSHFAKLLNLPRPPGEGRDHEEVSSGSVVVEQEAESPISVQITGRRWELLELKWSVDGWMNRVKPAWRKCITY